MPNEILVGSYNALLHKLFSMKEGAPAPTLSPEYVAAIVVESDRPEYAFPKGERVAMAGAISPALALNLSSVSLENPAGSGVLIVLEGLWGRSTGGAEIFWQVFGAVATGTSQAVNTRDTRLGVNYVAGRQTGIVGIVRVQQELVSLITAAGGFYRAPNEWWQNTDMRVMLAPGTSIVFENNTSNNSVEMVFFWRERILDPAETR